MKYPIAIEHEDDTHAYGVVVPDLPGCFSAGDTLDEAFENAKEAIAGWIELEIDEGHPIPKASSLDEISKMDEFKGWYLGVVEVSPESLSDKVQRINITLPARVLRRLDEQAKHCGATRSGYIAQMVLTQASS